MLKAGALLLCLMLLGCGSQPRKLHYYALTAEPGTPVVHQFSGSIGVGPVSLPEVHIGDAVLYQGARQTVVVSDRHLWAGNLSRAVSRVLAQGLGKRLDKTDVLSFPWDPRMRPARQIMIAINQFSGQLDGEVVLEVTWSHFDPASGQILFTKGERFTAPPQSRSVAEYVTELNGLLNQFADRLAEEFAGDL